MPGMLRAPLRRLIELWTEVRLAEPTPDKLALDPQLPTLYVLPRPSLSDALLLDSYCQRHGLPQARGRLALPDSNLPRCVALPARRFRLWPGQATGVAPFTELITSDTRIQLVPVSVFWGRAPGKDFGLWHLLAADSWRLTGRLRRALSVLVNGRDVEIQFGAPLHLEELHDGDAPRTNRKAARLLRVHFRRVRTRVLGPDLSHRSTMIQGVVASDEVRREIDQLAEKPSSRKRLKRRARRYGYEIAANMTYPVLRFLAGALKRLWNRLYDGVDVNGLEEVKALAEDHTLIYVPCHRSHIDYLLLSYVLYREGLMPPHIAAGRNLDMPLIGPLLRRGGAFFLRRSFRDNRLYGAVFNEYLHRLLARGYPMEYFIEGGRSRSGRMLTPRPGMLAMTLRSFLRCQRVDERPMVFVPVYIGYERILENSSYQRELGGGKKRKESPLDLLRVLGRLREPYGRVSVNIGEPLPIGGFLDSHAPGWRDDESPRPDWLAPTVTTLGRSLTRRINRVAALNAINLTGLALLSSPHRALEYATLTDQLALLCRLADSPACGERPSLPDESPEACIARAVDLDMVERHAHSLGDIVSATPEQAALLAWYRNNVLHLFALPALVAFAFRSRHQRTLHELCDLLTPLWPPLAREFCVDESADMKERLAAILAVQVDLGLLERHGEGFTPVESLEGRERLELIGRMIQPSLERNALLIEVLLRSGSGALDRATLKERSRALSERLGLLSGREAPEFFDPKLFETLIDTLEQEGWVWLEQDRLHFDECLKRAAQRASRLLDASLRRRLALISRHREEAIETPSEVSAQP
ncbi:glycerol-3-phosphate 1-O-acyltransferase PlsB [Halomonas sp. DP5N14-9]|uniref:glycerol-3-phosphate 1-O-acyltransferase PlsB n=1 Tax=Halomonas sp. DP5N14-9 TaxID=2859075 RepID=UPI001C99A13C|nr:glycerol-3-phosphate 1-O-acyltransferase PlsB [Halomonas sp. DP5N14-9]MBY5943395.1 glycerol-3-phosphate 1-O-acyltransferase PlsB [Halomonas sp. DP5N14-9]